MYKKILVTGGCGFIGSNFIRYTLKKEKKVSIINLDKLTYSGNPDNLKDIERNTRYKFVKGDICDKKVVSGIVKGCDVIVNFAAESHVDRSIMDATPFIKTNVFGVQVLLDAARDCRVKRFIQISTDEVYGSITRGSFKENSPLLPNSPYAASKASSDLLVRSYFVTYKLPTIIIRSCNNFGPYQYPEKIIPLFITNTLEGKKLPLYADGSNVREWLYVIDNCDAILFILKNGKPGQIYNVGSNCELKNIELTKRILGTLGKKSSLIEFVKDRPGHDKRYSLDFAKLRALGWRPRYTFERALCDTILWYKNNKKWWRRLKKEEKFW